jgi:hypothetical protein
MKKHLSILAFLLAVTVAAVAQNRVITGKVTSADDGSNVPGVNVILKGTTTGTITDANGDYSLTVPNRNGALVFSFIGSDRREAAQ